MIDRLERIKLVKFLKTVELSKYGNPYKTVLEKITLSKDELEGNNDITVDFCYDEDVGTLEVNFEAKRLETDAEFKVRVDIKQKEAKRKENILKGQKGKDIATIMTLMKKNNLKPSDLLP